jgi:5'-nucleotidase
MRILLTNDDGFEAPGIIAMAKALAPLGEVTVIAPDGGRSSCSSALSLRTPVHLEKREGYGEGIEVISCSGTTADCAKLGLEYWMKDCLPDLIISGINEGYNVGSDCLYSGTVAGAMEGSFFQIPAMAVSAGTTKEPELLERCAAFSVKVVKKYFMEHHYQGILNLNLPKDMSRLHEEALRVVPMVLERYENAVQELDHSENGVTVYISGKALPSEDEDSDVYWIHQGYPTLTPISWNQTDRERLAIVKKISEQ